MLLDGSEVKTNDSSSSSRIESNYDYDFSLNGSFFPNHNIISFASHNNMDLNGESLLLGDLTVASANQVFRPNFKNNSFADIMNYYENLVTCSQWDVRENGDYETIVLGRSNYFYNCLKYNWKQTGNFIDDLDKILKDENEKLNENNMEIDEEGNVIVNPKTKEEKLTKEIVPLVMNSTITPPYQHHIFRNRCFNRYFFSRFRMHKMNTFCM